MNKFADLHCHPHMRSFNWLRHSKVEEKKKEKFHPWHVVASKIKSKKDGKRANAYSQCDLIKLKNGNMKLAFVALYPMEKGWFTGREKIPKGAINKGINAITNNGFIRSLADQNFEWIEKLFVNLGKSGGSKIAFRDFLQGIFLKLPNRRVQFLQGPDYNYFKELNEERNFLLTKNKKETPSELFIPNFKDVFVSRKKLLKKYPKEFSSKGTYEIISNKGDLLRIDGDDEKMAFVFTIEGSNVFNTEESLDKILPRIEQVKNWEDTPVFFISLSHHFNNHVCGHAHSIPDYGGLVMDQSPGMDSGFTEKGKKIIRYFLSLDDHNKKNESLGRRILIDVKHMSALSRKYYYEEIIQKCRNIHGDEIPIIASHVAYSGIETLDELITNAPNENDKDGVSTFEKPFNTWNINISDEDIIEVFKSNGIIGINLDQRILAVPKKEKKRTYPDDYDIGYFWENLKGMMKVIIDNDLANKEKVVDLFALGTDFDGYIDPLDKYPTVLEFDDFREALIKKINLEEKGVKDELLFSLITEDFVDKVCYQNAYDFAFKYLE